MLNVNDIVYNQDENRASAHNPVRSAQERFKFHQQKRPADSNPRPCRPQVIPFDTEKQADMSVHFELLKNFETDEVPKSGEFVIRILYMGQLFGYVPSGNVTIQSNYYTASDGTVRESSPDLFLDYDISFCVKFKDMVNNPLVLHLCRAGNSTGNDNYARLVPFGFICLDMGRILNYKAGKVEHYLEPWILPNKQALGSRIPAERPSLQLTLECFGGLPDKNQLLQGNLMTVFCESLYNLPLFVQQNVADQDNLTDAQMFMTLPCAQSDATFNFAGGRLKGGIVDTLQKAFNVDDGTQTGTGTAEVAGNGMPKASTVLGPSQLNKDQEYWASVAEYSGDIPLEATVMSGETSLDVEDNAESEIYGDGREDYLEFRETGEGRMVWSSVHKRYLAVESYRSMLTRLSQNAIWPLEIAIAIKRKPGVDRSKKKTGNKAPGGNQDSDDRMIMAELGTPSLSNNRDFTLIFHGIAFVDLSCLVYPGMKNARFACKVYPFSSDLLQKRTCLMKSVVSETLLETFTHAPKSNFDLSKGTSMKSKAQTNKPNDLPKAESQLQLNGQTKGRGSRNSNGSGNDGSLKKEDSPITVVASIERTPFIVFRVSMLRSIVPFYKSKEVSKIVHEYLPKRELNRRKLISASNSQQIYRKAILEAASEISHEFSEHYWKEVLQNGQGGADQSSPNPPCNETLKKGFLFYLNASGRYLVLREHLRNAISNVVQQKCLNLRPSGFHNHRDFQSYLHDMYIYLVDEMNEVLSSTTLQETDPLKSNLDRLLQQTNCIPEEELSRANLHNRQITDLGIFAEESFAQGDFEACHKLHLQRICRDKESARTWTEFSIMWLARGDDRMAEIAVKEALRQDPLHLYALIVSGLISVRHGDERGLECLGAALGLFPMAPEILVIVGISNSLIGNDIAADYFFRKAAYVHRVITGQPVDNLNEVFSKSKSFNMKRFAEDLDNGVSYEPEVVQEPEKEKEELPIPGEDPPVMNKQSGKTKHTRKSKKSFSIVETDAQITIQEDVKKTSITGQGMNDSLNDQQPGGPSFYFTETFDDILPDEVVLPGLSPSIQSPHDMTIYSEKLAQHLKAIELEARNPPKKQNEDGNLQFQKDAGIVSDTTLYEEYEKLSNEEKPKKAGKSNKKRNSEKKPGDDAAKSRSPVPETKDEVSKAVEAESSPILPKLTDRLGSELIWAASLLINLRLFDFVDGILAKHLYFYGTRTVQFIYLRALSLYLRQREDDALPLLKEAIAIDNTMGIYHALEGHCYYMLGFSQQAVDSYERALKLPHSNENRHLLYLRYGSLVLDQSKSKIAKRVFLHGVSKYPTPYMWLALGSACFQHQEYDQAESAFAEANRLDSTNPIAWGHLSLSSLMQDKKALAEQSYKWALRFGLKKGALLDEIQRLQKEKGFGDPSFPRIPNCVPHEYYLRRMGRLKPFNIYKEALNQDPPGMARARYEDTENEKLLKKPIVEEPAMEEMQGEVEDWEAEEIASETSNYASEAVEDGSYGFNRASFSQSTNAQVVSAPPDLVKSASGTITTIKQAASFKD